MFWTGEQILDWYDRTKRRAANRVQASRSVRARDTSRAPASSDAHAAMRFIAALLAGS